jgi:predicted DNA-binding transcriptional regulator YafY
MAVNKLALIRYKAIDSCLRNRYRKWTLEDLIDKVSDVLYGLEGIEDGVSRRTIQADIQLMRSNKLGYNAPIVVKDKKFYCYSDPEYSITNAPINEADLEKMHEIVGLLKQFNGFNYFEEMSDMIARLENSLYKTTQGGTSYIQLENNRMLKGLEHITPIYQAILKKQAVLINYKSFKARESHEEVYFPYLLKEYRNRWFLIARNKRKPQLITLALDRMISIKAAPAETFEPYKGIDFETYYNELLGVTRSETQRPRKVILFVSEKHAPYVLTKPLHHTQQLLKQDETGMIIRIDVVLNFELEREILGFGEGIKVLGPRTLQYCLKKRLAAANSQYTGNQLPPARYKRVQVGQLQPCTFFRKPELTAEAAAALLETEPSLS